MRSPQRSLRSWPGSLSRHSCNRKSSSSTRCLSPSLSLSCSLSPWREARGATASAAGPRLLLPPWCGGSWSAAAVDMVREWGLVVRLGCGRGDSRRGGRTRTNGSRRYRHGSATETRGEASPGTSARHLGTTRMIERRSESRTIAGERLRRPLLRLAPRRSLRTTW